MFNVSEIKETIENGVRIFEQLAPYRGRVYFATLEEGKLVLPSVEFFTACKASAIKFALDRDADSPLSNLTNRREVQCDSL